ncbi:hypothetical protein Taro_003273, partial [Colocasia esculenta]|nr:hypothetical protein [Colocasia esculenta]
MSETTHRIAELATTANPSYTKTIYENLLEEGRTYNSNTGVRVSRKTTQTSTVPHCTGTNPEHNKHTCLAHKELG